MKILALAALAAASAGCPKPPPPEPPPPPAEVKAEPPPPPPKCESISEKCQGKPDTKAKITNSELVFVPATGWIYAQQSSSTIAQTADGTSGIVFLGIQFDAKDFKKEAATRDAAIAELVKQLGVAPLKRKVNWKKPQKDEAIGTLKMQLWQLDEPGMRGAKKGQVLVVSAPAGDGKVVVGVGYVPDDDSSGADVAIMKSIESLGKAP
jgi:hypothetical protein